MPKAAPRVVAVSSHPIQYQAPWFRALAQVADIEFSVIFLRLLGPLQQGRGFGQPFEWDTPLLDGYSWRQAQTGEVNSAKPLQFLGSLRRPLALFRALNPDVVLLMGWHEPAMIWALLAARWAGIPVIMRGDSNALRPRPMAMKLLHKALLRTCTAFLPVGQANRAFYRGYGIRDDAMFDAPHFVDNQFFSACAASFGGAREHLRRQWNVPGDATCFCYAGKLESKKRLPDLLAALRIARSRQAPPMHLLVVGSGELLEQTRQFADLHQLPVTFTGFLNQSEIASAYVASDCLVLPSDYGETWGLVVNEAMACAKPAIVSDRVGCGPDLVTQGETGAIFHCGDTVALADLLVRLASDRAALQAMGERARARVSRDYSIEKAVEGALRAIRCVVFPTTCRAASD